MNKNKNLKLSIELSIVLISALLAVLSLYFIPPKIIRQFEEKTYDWRFTKKIQQNSTDSILEKTNNIIIVDITDSTLSQLEPLEQKALRYYTQLIQKIQKGTPGAIGLNLPFPNQYLKNPAEVDSLKKVIRAAGNVVIAVPFASSCADKFLLPDETPPAGLELKRFSCRLSESNINRFPVVDRFEGNAIRLYHQAVRIGFSNFLQETLPQHTIIRKIPLFVNYAGRQYPCLALALLKAVTEKVSLRDTLHSTYCLNKKGEVAIRVTFPHMDIPIDVILPTDTRGYMFVNFHGPFGTIPTFTSKDILSGKIEPTRFVGKTVIIGTSSRKLFDWYQTPFGCPLPATEIHANMLRTLLTQAFIRRMNPYLVTGLLFILLFALTILTSKMRLHYSTAIGVALFLIYGLLALLLFTKFDIWLDLGIPIYVNGLAFIAITGFRYLLIEKDTKIIKSLFNDSLSSKAVDKLLENPEQLEFIGEERVGTLMFAQITNFSDMLNQLPPKALVAFLNEFLESMSQIILKYDGYLEKYTGNQIKAIFNVPLINENHMYNACQAALEMQQQLSQLRVKWELERRPPIKIAIGLHLGKMIVGNIGGDKRADYMVIGQSVSLTARLQQINAKYGTGIIISEALAEKIQNNAWIRELDLIRLNGTIETFRIFELIAKKEKQLERKKIDVLTEFEKGLAIYRSGNWASAYNRFQKALRTDPSDGPSRLLFQRCRTFIEENRRIPADWDGVCELN